MADIDRVELLMRLSENIRIENNEWRMQVFKEGQERAKRVMDMIARFEREYGALNQELELLRQYIPRQQQQLPEEMPRAVTQGPRANEPVQRKVNP